ncbi:MAG: hypothetical protein CMP11_02650 [Zetaproteobacteria bacterium]|nr:hypothetical protein [Pseudobdellovibrionaceae bacterium]|tara:strand:- start:284 stop:634 length:351 start_codon:yes stop_codon:yes gene_type:complete
MWIFVGKTLVAAMTISFCSWLSNKRPELAGFIVALPLTTILVLLFSQAEFQDPNNSIRFAKSIFLGVPVSMLFFIPFLFAEKLNLNFWTCFASGIGLITIGYWLHKSLMNFFMTQT